MQNSSVEEFRHFEHEGWQRVAAAYDPGFGAVTRQSTVPILDAVGAAAGIPLLDIACGPGYIASAAVRRGCSAVVGVDFSAAMIAAAREKEPSLDFRVGDAEALEFPDNAFAAVVMNFGMLHLAEPDKAIGEAFRVLRKGGRYAFTVWDAPPKTVAFEIVLDAIRRYGTMDVALPEGPPFFRFSDVEESARTLSAAGFADIRSVVVPQTWSLESSAGLFLAMRDSAVRTAALLNRQTAEALRHIEAAILQRAEDFRSEENGTIELAMPAILTSGVKAG